MEAYLKPNEEIRILAGHPWIFANEVKEFKGNIVPGEIIRVYNSKNIFIGIGYLNVNSKIIIRMLTLKDEVIDEEFFHQRIKRAYNARLSMGYNDNARIIFSEADLLPGLVVDKYGDYLVVEISTLGMEIKRDLTIRLLNEVIKPKGIYERSDSPSRLKEGLELRTGFIGPSFNPIIQIKENDFIMEVDLAGGQKTGYFLDQKENRKSLKTYVKNKKVLDCFTHTGGFAIHAAGYGAKEVTAIDISQEATEKVKRNAYLNNFTNVKSICCDAFEYLKDIAERKEMFDVIILDPPAFTKNKDTVKSAYAGYEKINTLAMKAINDGGYLLTFSCSQHMVPELFLQMLQDASRKAGVITQMIDFRIQAKDHPVMMGNLESLYLKCVVLRIIK